YLLPSKLPMGWKLKLATERPGRPLSAWQDHWEILTTAAQDRYLLLVVHLLGAGDSSQDTPGKPGPVIDVPTGDFVLSIAYSIQRGATAPDPNTLHARGVEWHNARFAFRVAELASAP